jgi:hypothetical protein
MMTCGKEIDGQPFKEGMSNDDALKIAVAHTGYAVLSTTYLEEAFNRALWFIDNKQLSSAFLAADRDGKILRPTR